MKDSVQRLQFACKIPNDDDLISVIFDDLTLQGVSKTKFAQQLKLPQMTCLELSITKEKDEDGDDITDRYTEEELKQLILEVGKAKNILDTCRKTWPMGRHSE
jgi:peptidyl-tRNA hydrolase